MMEREVHDGIVLLRLAHGKASALDVELLEALASELDAARDARAVVLTGSGSIFSAGVDLFRVVDGGRDYVARFFPLLVDVLRKMFVLPVPLVVAANGHAIAGGAIFVAAADRRLMAEGKGRIGVPELLVGVPFPALALELVRFAIGSRAQSLALSGRTLLPEEALAIGFVDDVVVPDLLVGKALDAARQLAAIPRVAFRLAKQQLRKPHLDLADSFRDADAEALAAWSDPASHATIRDYLAKTVRK
jgi:enoyl-CoA hydratase